jgi:hypothetical protein
MFARLVAAALAGALGACASAPKARAVDLRPARQALEQARAEGAAERAPQTFNRAQGELQEAERLVAERGPDAPMAAVEAEWAARLALAEARCASREAPSPATPPEEIKRLETRARRSEEEQRRLEEQIALRLRELQVTETELIRTKARLKGLETRAEASSAIAEARILVKRVESRGRSATLKAAEEDLEKAEGLLQEENYGAALFFALKAQDMVTKAGDNRAAGAEGSEAERPAPQGTYVVAVDSANIRQSPSTQAPVLAEVKRGTTLRALALRGTWAKVAHEAVTGWVSLRLLE